MFRLIFFPFARSSLLHLLFKSIEGWDTPMFTAWEQEPRQNKRLTPKSSNTSTFGEMRPSVDFCNHSHSENGQLVRTSSRLIAQRVPKHGTASHAAHRTRACDQLCCTLHHHRRRLTIERCPPLVGGSTPHRTHGVVLNAWLVLTCVQQTQHHCRRKQDKLIVPQQKWARGHH